MFTKLFAESGLSLDRLRALVEVGAAGGIGKAVSGDPVRQSQYSRQIKELEDFFQTRLVERHGKGVRLTGQGRELARISRFFLLGLSNFQRGTSGARQVFRVGAPPTFTLSFLGKALAVCASENPRINYTIEPVFAEEAERRLHDLTLDFAVVSVATLSRPLQASLLGEFRMKRSVPKALGGSAKRAAHLWNEGRLPIACATRELSEVSVGLGTSDSPRLVCGSFFEAKDLVEMGKMAALLPDYLAAPLEGRQTLVLEIPSSEHACGAYSFAWNPRLLRLNPQAVRGREQLYRALKVLMDEARSVTA